MNANNAKTLLCLVLLYTVLIQTLETWVDRTCAFSMYIDREKSRIRMRLWHSASTASRVASYGSICRTLLSNTTKVLPNYQVSLYWTVFITWPFHSLTSSADFSASSFRQGRQLNVNCTALFNVQYAAALRWLAIHSKTSSYCVRISYISSEYSNHNNNRLWGHQGRCLSQDHWQIDVCVDKTRVGDAVPGW